MTTPTGPHHICSACGEISNPSVIDIDERTLTCVSCGHAHRFTPLPPLLFLTGPSGAGKTAVYHQLLGHTAEAVLIDQDLLWGLSHDFDDPATDYRSFRTMVFAMGMRIAANGVPVMIEGTTVPWQYENLPSRPLVSRTSYLALVCDDDLLESRLRRRPPWRGYDDARIRGMVEMNRALKDQAAGWAPPVHLLDTTGHTVLETAEVVHEWIRTETREWRSPGGG